ncbi:MAG: NAD(P)/FAD-dependent oxidoreductase [Candidatus Sulfotelmatobacter sp.]
MHTPDIFIVGGGPAGLATAIAARQRGFEVTVADGSRPPIDKPCGEGLMPDACAALSKLGITVPAEESQPFRGIKFAEGGPREDDRSEDDRSEDGHSVEANFPGGTGMGIRRTVLHRLMIARAEAAGVALLWQTPVTGLHPEGVRVAGDVIRARWVIGADGRGSRVRSWAGLDHGRKRKRFAFRQHYGVPPWNACMEVHWGRTCQIYVTPVAADEICIAVASREPHLRLDRALLEFPEIAWRLRGAACSSNERGAISSTREIKSVYQGNIALVGDASGTVDCITGEGLGLAFRQADLLAESLAQGDLAAYQRGHRALARRPAFMARLLLALDWNSSLRRRAMRAFAADPSLFGRMVAMHVGALSPLNFAASGLSLGWQLLLA